MFRRLVLAVMVLGLLIPALAAAKGPQGHIGFASSQ